MAIVNRTGFAVDRIIADGVALPNKATMDKIEVSVTNTSGVVALVVEAADNGIKLESNDLLLYLYTSDDTALPVVAVGDSYTGTEKNYDKGDLIFFVNIPTILAPDVRKYEFKLSSAADLKAKKFNAYTVIR